VDAPVIPSAAKPEEGYRIDLAHNGLHGTRWSRGMSLDPGTEQYREVLEALLLRIPSHEDRWIACAPGWFPLIAELHDHLLDLDPNYVVLQLKEKFAALRYHAGTSSSDPLIQERFSALIEVAERLSKTMCELCGHLARLSVCDDHDGPRYKTICVACATELAAAGGRFYQPQPPRSMRGPVW
jgi:hypothetical protein